MNTLSHITISGSSRENLNELLLLDFKTQSEWFHDNHKVIDPYKFSYMCLGNNNNDNDTLGLNEFNMKNGDKATISGIKIDRILTDNKHIKTLHTKADQKMCA